MKNSMKRVRRVAAALCGGLVAAACFGAQSGGTDGETHFACSVDRDCLPLGPGFVCVEGICRMDPRRPDVDAPPSPSSSKADAGRDAATSVVGGNAPASAARPPSPPPGDARVDAPLPPPGTFQGSIVADARDPVDMSDLAVALVWLPLLVDRDVGAAEPTAECMDFYMPLGTVVQPSSSTVVPPSGGKPGTFTLTPIGVPPDEAFPSHIPVGPGSTLSVSDHFLAIGEIIVYRDVNHDGMPNLGSFATGDGESVVGASSTYMTAYGSQTNSVSYGVSFARHAYLMGEFLYPAGYHAFRDVADWDVFITRTNVAEETEIPIRLTSEIGVSGLSCVENCFSDAPRACPSTIPELPAGGTGTCLPLGAPTPPAGRPSTTAAYVWETRLCEGCRCTTQSCGYPWAPGEPKPVGWPCEDLPVAR